MTYNKTLMVSGARATASSINEELNKIEAEFLDQAAADVLSHTIYVDAVSGNDGTADGTSGLPFLTIQAAIDSVNTASNLAIYLLSDLHIEERILLPISGKFEILGEKADLTKSVITFANEATNDAGKAPRFDYFSHRGQTFTAVNCHFQLREFTGGITSTSIIQQRGFAGFHALLCEIEALPNCNQSVLGGYGGFGIAMTASTTTDMAGHWVDGVAASTDPLSLKECAYSTLATL